jgi:hypothetical protein
MTREAARTFPRLVGEYARRGPERALVNVTFFMGAGFSKAWDSRFPTSRELYAFSRQELAEHSADLGQLLASLGDRSLDRLTPDRFKDLVYQLNMQLRYPGIRTRFMDEWSIRLVLGEIKALVQRRFDSIMPVNHFDEARQKFPLPPARTPAQDQILAFFARLFAAGSLRVNFITTNYDFLLETILDNAMGRDSVFSRIYRGVTPRCVSGLRTPRLVHDPRRASLLIKLNGGFEVLGDGDGYILDYRRRSPEAVKAAPPIIMLPSREQDYTDTYFSGVFPKAVRLLQESRILVIAGYSLPEEDALLRFLLRQFAEDPGDAAAKHIFYVDLIPAEEQVARLRQCFHYLAQEEGLNIFPYSGRFTDWLGEMGE